MAKDRFSLGKLCLGSRFRCALADRCGTAVHARVNYDDIFAQRKQALEKDTDSSVLVSNVEIVGRTGYRHHLRSCSRGTRPKGGRPSSEFIEQPHHVYSNTILMRAPVW